MKPRSIFYGITLGLVIFLIAYFIYTSQKPDDPLDDKSSQLLNGPVITQLVG